MTFYESGRRPGFDANPLVFRMLIQKRDCSASDRRSIVVAPRCNYWTGLVVSSIQTGCSLTLDKEASSFFPAPTDWYLKEITGTSAGGAMTPPLPQSIACVLVGMLDSLFWLYSQGGNATVDNNRFEMKTRFTRVLCFGLEERHIQFETMNGMEEGKFSPPASLPLGLYLLLVYWI